MLRGDLGASLWRRTPVLEEIAARWPVTVELGLLGSSSARSSPCPIGIYSAVRQDSLGDYAGRSFAIFWVAVPGFWVATLGDRLPLDLVGLLAAVPLRRAVRGSH